MKRNYSSEHLASLEFDETALAWHWVKMSIPAYSGYCDVAGSASSDDVADYLEELQRDRWDIDMPRFTVGRVNYDRLRALVFELDEEGV
jgi:hypothetical protein